MAASMRSLFGFIAFATVLIVAGAALIVPPVVGPMVATAVRAASPFGDQPLDVQVDVNALGLIRGFVSEIRVSGTNLGRDGVSIESLDVTAHGVGIGDHAFAETTGGLQGVSIPTDDGSVINVDRITLSGPSKALTAVAHLDRAGAVAFIQHALEVQGVAVTGLELTSGGIALVIFEQRVELQVGVQDGALVIPDMLGGGPLELLTPFPDDPWRLSSATLTTAGMDIDATVDASRLLAGE
jgi:hypothetical protein